VSTTSLPHLLAIGLPLQTQWFVRARARPHTENVVLYFPHDTFDSPVISNRFLDHFGYGQNWPLNSPDLNPCDCFIWGFLKEKMFPKEPQAIMEL
jgi:hypothetical protein